MKFNPKKIMVSIAAATFIVFAFATAPAQSGKRSSAAIAYAKEFPVSRMEKNLPRQPFAVWFQKLAGRETPIEWSVDDCGEQTGDPAVDRGRDFPMCVEARAKRADDFHISVSVQYGTFKSGIAPGKPFVRSIFCGDETGQDGASFDTLKELARHVEKLTLDAEFFDPNDGVFVISGDSRPPDFEDFEEMRLETRETNAKGENVPRKPKGEITFGQTNFALREIYFDGKRWTFETISIGGVSYRFDGGFSKIKLDYHGRQNGESILRGRLTKIVGGRQTAQADLIFSFLAQGE